MYKSYKRHDGDVTSRILFPIQGRGLYIEARWPVNKDRDNVRRTVVSHKYFGRRYGVPLGRLPK